MSNADDLWAELEGFGLSAAKEDAAAAEARDQVTRRPPWAMAEFPIERVTGKVTAITRGTKVTNNGLSIPQFELHIPEPYGVEGNYDSGEVILTVVEPKKGGRNSAEAELYWMLESAQALDPSVDNPAHLIGVIWTFELDARKKWETAQYHNYYYKVVEKLSARTTPAGKAQGAPQGTVVANAAISMPLKGIALGFLIGKTMREFVKDVMKDPTVRGAAQSPEDLEALNQAVISGSFIKDAVADGLITQGVEGYELREVVAAEATA